MQLPEFDSRVAYCVGFLISLLRYLSGCGVRKPSNEGALWILDSFLDPSCDPVRYIGNTVPRTLLAQAHSFAAKAYHNKSLASPSGRSANVADE